MVRTGKQVDIYDVADAQPFGPLITQASSRAATTSMLALLAFHAASTVGFLLRGDAGLEFLALLGRARQMPGQRVIHGLLRAA